MTGYLLSVLGIVLASVLINIIIPTGELAKYIKSVFSIFVVFVLISPIFTFLNKEQQYMFSYNDYEINEKLINYVFSKRTDETKARIIEELTEQGFEDIDIILSYSAENNELSYNYCTVNLKNMTIRADKQHINKYEFIKNVVIEYTNLTEEEIQFYE